MAETAHTPGPWRAGASTFYRGLDGPMTMRVYTDHPPTEFEVTGDNITANACLIAAAPDLLDALKDAVAHLEEDAEKDARDLATAFGVTDWRKVAPHTAEIVSRARSAIARATGETP